MKARSCRRRRAMSPFTCGRSAMRRCMAEALFIRPTALCCKRTRWRRMTFRTRVRGDGKFRLTAGPSPSASGVLAVPAIAMALGRLSGDRVRDIALATVALLFTALTTVLLVWDLDHKERFLRVVFTPQSKSWLARGAFILIAYSGLCGVFWLAAVAGFPVACRRSCCGPQCWSDFARPPTLRFSSDNAKAATYGKRRFCRCI